MPKIENTLSSYRDVATFLDNDEAGKRAAQELEKVCKNINNQSFFYSEHKDLNEYFCSRLQQKYSVKQSSAEQREFKKKPGTRLKF